MTITGVYVSNNTGKEKAQNNKMVSDIVHDDIDELISDMHQYNPDVSLIWVRK